MREKVLRRIKIIVSAMCCGIVMVQLIYALCWAWQNGNNIQDFYDTTIYFQNAESLCSDAWRLLGYSCIINIFMSFKCFLGEYYIVILYLFQVLCTLLCFAEGVRCVGKYLFEISISYAKALFPAIYITTLPVIWQMQFAVLPDALCLSLVVLLMAKLLECLKGTNKKWYYNIFVLSGCLLLIGVLERHYFYGAILLLLFHVAISLMYIAIRKYRKESGIKNFFVLIVLMISIPAVVGIVNSKVPVSEEYTPYSLEADCLSRFVYPNIKTDYSFYSKEVQEILPEEMIQAQNLYYEQYLSELGVFIEEKYDGQVEDVFVHMVKVGFSVRSKEIIKGSVKEMIAYTIIPFTVVKNMYSNGNSLYGHNYIKMYERSPGLTADYMHCGMNGFLLISLMGLIYGLLQLKINKQMIYRKIGIFIYGLICLLSVTMPMMFFSVMKFDYRIGLFAIFLWGIFSFGAIFSNYKVQRVKGA